MNRLVPCSLATYTCGDGREGCKVPILLIKEGKYEFIFIRRS